jgi:NAD(P)H-dependent FMN reductase
MLKCPACGRVLAAVPENATDAFHCEKCGSQLRASLRYKPVMHVISSVVAVLLRFATLRFNPRINPQKTSKLASAIEALLTRFSWRTGLVEVAVDRSSNNSAAASSSSKPL